MQDLKPPELAELASLLVTLMIFFSIDAKFRFNRKEVVAKGLFRATSIVGGVFTAVALAVVWVEIFLPEDNKAVNVLLYFIPASIAILAALMLSVEVIFLRKRDEDNNDDDDDDDDGERKNEGNTKLTHVHNSPV